MPSIAQVPLSPAIIKKRRRDDGPENSEAQIKLSSTFSSPSPNRKLLAPAKRRLHDMKRQRIDLENLDLHLSMGAICYDSEPLAGCAANPDITPMSERVGRTDKIDLSPCYICWRKPTGRKELDAFAYCECCAKRTCYICIRECEGLGVTRCASMGGVDACRSKGFGEERGEGWQRKVLEGHRGRICSRCCVERGTDGEVWCLGCLKAENEC